MKNRNKTSDTHQKINQVLSIAIPVSEEQEWAHIDFESIAIHSVSVNSDGDIILTPLTKIAEVGMPLFVGVFYRNDENYNVANSILQLQSGPINFRLAELVKIDSLDPHQLLSQVNTQLVRFTLVLTAFNRDLMLSQNTLRLEYEKIHRRFSALDSFIQSADVKLIRERISLLPEQEQNDDFPRLDLGRSVISQTLPTYSSGLAAVSLRLGFIDPTQGTKISVSLRVGDNPHPEFRWIIASEDILESGGWIILSLNRAIDSPNKSVVLQVDLREGELNTAWIGLGPVSANNQYVVHEARTNESISNRCLALRTWEAPPGTAVPVTANMIRPTYVRSTEPNNRISTRHRLSAPALEKVKSGTDDSWASGFSPVIYDHYTDAICVHPPNNGYTLAVINGIIPSSANLVIAKSMIANEKSNDIEFCIAIFDPELARLKAGDMRSPIAGTLSWSGWTRVSASMGKVLLSVIVPEETKDKFRANLSLALITKMSSGRNNDFAWARFIDIEVE